MTGFRFGLFEVDVHAGEVRRQGQRIKLQEKPFQTLVVLLEHAGEVVTREQLRERLWPADTFVEFDDNLNTTIKRLREALGDAADSPRYVETVPRRGYRFIPPVEQTGLGQPAAVPPAVLGRKRLRLVPAIVSAAVLLLLGVVYLLQTRPRPASKIMLAVLPFHNLSGEATQDYISDGMTEELIAHLGRLSPQKLGVISRSSVMRFKSATEDIASIAHDLGVTYLLEGSVRQADGHIHVTAQLVQAGDRTHLWSETYERAASDLFAIQRDVARSVTEALAIRLLPAEESALARASTTNTAAYDAYLNGLYQWNRGTQASFETALASFEKAASLDPGYAMAHDGAARCYLELANYQFLPAAEAYRKAQDHVSTALRLDDSIPESHAAAAAILDKTDPNAPGIEDAYRKAIALNPSYALAQRNYALYLLNRKRSAESISEISEAMRLDPLSPSTICYGAWILYSAERYRQSQETVKRALALDPNYPFALYIQGHLYTYNGKLDEAIAEFQKAVVSSGRTPKYLFTLANAYLRAGKRDAAAPILSELRDQAKTRYVDAASLEALNKKIKAN